MFMKQSSIVFKQTALVDILSIASKRATITLHKLKNLIEEKFVNRFYKSFFGSFLDS